MGSLKVKGLRMIVTDLDNTLLTRAQEVSPITRGVFEHAREQGLLIAFATARAERATRFVQEAITPDYIIADNGAMIWRGGKVLFSHMIPRATRDALIDAFLATPSVTAIAIECVDCLYTSYSVPSWGKGWETIFSDFGTKPDRDSPKLSVECDDDEA